MSRQIGIYEGNPVIVEENEYDCDVKCPTCGCVAGERDEERHSPYGWGYTCQACGYYWTEVEGYNEPTEELADES